MNDLEQIKEILFGNEKKALNALLRRLDTHESRTADVADVLPDAVTRSYNQDERLGKALSKPVEESLSDAIRRQPKKFADALFPVMGPAIRKAIAEALKSMLQSLNTAIDTSISISARIKAKRAGLSLAEYVLQQNLVYRVDEIYLIDPASGLLVSHMHHPDVSVKDEDAVSGMFTAIQDFVSDSFTGGSGDGLSSVGIGDKTVWLSQGPLAMLACVIRGVPPVKLKEEIAVANERLHLRYYKTLKDSAGNPESLPGISMELEELLQIEHRNAQSGKKKMAISWPLLIALTVIGAVLIWLAVNSFITQRKMTDLAEKLEMAPGFVVTGISNEGSEITLRGLQDPLAGNLQEIVADIGIKPEKIKLLMAPFQSLEHDIVLKRAIRILEQPAGVSITLEGETLVISGSANSEWRERLTLVGGLLPGIAGVDATGLRAGDDIIAARIRELLPDGYPVDVEVTQGVGKLSGEAPIAFHQQLDTLPARIGGLQSLDAANLSISEEVRLSQLRQILNRSPVFFEYDAVISAGQEVKLIELVGLLKEYSDVSKALGKQPLVNLVGFADGTGSESLNGALKDGRSKAMRTRLVDLGVEQDLLRVSQGPPARTSNVDASMRKVEIQIISP